MPSVVMQTTPGSQNNVPAFLMKLWRLVEDKKCDDLICWSGGGTTFLIRDQSRFSKELLPLYFKHNNMASFVRQLNMYGFRKVVNIEQGGLRAEKDELEFQHMYFMKSHEYLLELIKRKVNTGKGQPPQEDFKVEPQVVTKMLVDVKQLHGKQENLDVRLSSMKSENEVLWREVANLRQQHKKQQQIVNKLIQFLLSLVHPKRANPLGVRRKIPLMLNDVSHSAAKSPRYSRSFSVGNNICSSNEGQGGDNGDLESDAHIDSENLTSPGGPVIHDITDTFDAEAFLKGEVEAIPTITATSPGCDGDGQTQDEVVAGTSSNTTAKSDSHHQEHALGNVQHLNDLMNVIVQGDDPETAPASSVSTFGDTASAISDILVPVTDNDFNKMEFQDHLDTLQLELDTLKDFLSGNGCTIDPVSLLGVCPPSSFMQLFSNEDTASKGTMDSMTDFGLVSNNGNGIVGTELAQYNPTILGLGEDALIFDPDTILPHSPDACLNDSLFECVDGICEKPDDDAIQVSIPEQNPESLFRPGSSEDVKPSSGQHSPLGIATAEILTPASTDKND